MYKVLLKGHQKAINCLDISNKNNSIIGTGSDDKTVRLWDTRSNKAFKCIAGVFRDPVEALAFDASMSEYLYCSTTNSFYGFDMRMDKIIFKDPAIFHEHITTEDINAIAVHSKGQYIALSDDSGTVTVVDLSNFSNLKCLSDFHSTIVGALSFKPNSFKELTTGGFDCKTCIWDFISGRPKSNIDFSKNNLLNANNSNNNGNQLSQLFNPPFVQALAYLYQGDVLVCGLGDGTIHLLAPDFSTLSTTVSAHGGMISSLHATSDRCFLSAGVDGLVRCWAWESASPVAAKGKKNKKQQKQVSEASLSEYPDAGLQALWTVEHGRKINAAKGLGAGDTPSCVCVADTSSDLAIWTAA